MFIAVQPFVRAVAIRIDVAPALNRTAVGTLLAVMLARQRRDSTAEEAGDHERVCSSSPRLTVPSGGVA
jgi:hypothetical protein